MKGKYAFAHYSHQDANSVIQIVEALLAARGESTLGRAHRYCEQDQGARRRRCGDIIDNEQRRDCPQYLCAQRVPSAAGASAVLALLDDVPASPASRRLAAAPAALGTRPIVLSPRAARPWIPNLDRELAAARL
jgi:hypothetical protein